MNKIELIRKAGYEYEFEERLAMLLDGGMDTTRAERQAADEIIARYNLLSKCKENIKNI